MASTYSNIGVELQGAGDNPNTWGTILNGDLGFLDAAVSGVYNYSVGASTGTLPVTDGITSNARAAVVRVTGSPGADCTITISPNDMQKTYCILNATTGGFNLIFTQGSGGNVTVRNGTGTIIYCDGGGVTAAVRDVFADVDFDSAKVGGKAVVTDFSQQSTYSAVDTAADFLSFYDTSAVAHVKILFSAFLTALAATEGAAGFSRRASQAEADAGSEDTAYITSLKLQTKPITNLGTAAITGKTDDTSPDRSADYLLTYDASATALKKTIIQNLYEVNVLTKTANYVQAVADIGKEINFTTSSTSLTLLAPATAGDGFTQWIRNSASTGDVTLTGTVGTIVNRLLGPYECILIRSDGTLWDILVGENAVGARTVSVSTPSGGFDGDVWYQV